MFLFKDLSKDILYSIFLYLNPRTLALIAAVHPRLRHLVDAFPLWTHFIQKDFPRHIISLSESSFNKRVIYGNLYIAQRYPGLTAKQSKFMLAISTGNIKSFKKILNSYFFKFTKKEFINSITFLYSTYTPIHTAALCGRLTMLKVLVAIVGKNSLLQTNKTGYRALHYAARNNHPDVLKFLLKKGETLDKKRWTAVPHPLHIAVQYLSHEAVTFLLQHVTKNLFFPTEWDDFMYIAALKHDEAMVTRLMTNPFNACNYTSLIYRLIKEERFQSTILLFKHYQKWDIKFPVYFINPLLKFAIKERNWDEITLLAAQSDLYTVQSALLESLLNHQFALSEVLFQSGVTLIISMLYELILKSSSEHACLQVLQWLHERKKLNFDINPQDYACYSQSARIFTWIIQQTWLEVGAFLLKHKLAFSQSAICDVFLACTEAENMRFLALLVSNNRYGLAESKGVYTHYHFEKLITKLVENHWVNFITLFLEHTLSQVDQSYSIKPLFKILFNSQSLPLIKLLIFYSKSSPIKPMLYDFFWERILEKNEIETMDLFFSIDPDILQRVNWLGTTLLHSALAKPNLPAICEKMLQLGIGLEIHDRRMWTPLYVAVENDRLEAVETLLRLGANGEITYYGHTLLCWVIEKKTPAMAALLLKYPININTPNPIGKAPLWLAVEKDSLIIAEILLRQGANTDLVYQGQSLLHLAIQRKKVDMVALLISHAVDFKRLYYGMTPLRNAVINSTVAVVECLLQHGATPNEPEDNVSILLSATQRGEQPIIALLISYGAKSFKFEDTLPTQNKLLAQGQVITQQPVREKSGLQADTAAWHKDKPLQTMAELMDTSFICKPVKANTVPPDRTISPETSQTSPNFQLQP